MVQVSSNIKMTHPLTVTIKNRVLTTLYECHGMTGEITGPLLFWFHVSESFCFTHNANE